MLPAGGPGQRCPLPVSLTQALARLRHLPQVHGLLVGDRVTPPMEALCTHLHVFKSWSVVGGRSAAHY